MTSRFYDLLCYIKLAIEGLYNPVTDRLRRRDSVTAFLRNANSPYQLTDSSTALIDSVSLTGFFSFKYTRNGTFYIVLKHRNSLETWSRTGGESLFGVDNTYDFTSNVSQAYGGNMVLKGNKYCIYTGDVNKDGIIDASDFSLVEGDALSYTLGHAATDLNGDLIVDGSDFLIVDNNSHHLIQVSRPG